MLSITGMKNFIKNELYAVPVNFKWSSNVEGKGQGQIETFVVLYTVSMSVLSNSTNMTKIGWDFIILYFVEMGTHWEKRA